MLRSLFTSFPTPASASALSRSAALRASRWLCAALLLLCLAAPAEAAYMPVPWVFTDPKHDPFNPLKYITSNTLTAIAISLVLAIALIQSWMMFKWGGRCMLSMLVGEFAWAIGFGIRFGLHVDPDSQGKYIAYYLFIVLSPCAFIASEYVLMGRLARYIQSDKHLLISPQRITVVFVTSDISTFLIQAAGAGTSIAKDRHVSKIGEHIFLAGLVLQLFSFFCFMLVALRFLHRVRTREPHTWAKDAVLPWHRDWRTLLCVLLVSSVGILIRCCYRVSELSQGYQGHLATTEAFFYALDSLPLLLAIVVYVPFWPARMIRTIDTVGLPASTATAAAAADETEKGEKEGEREREGRASGSVEGVRKA